MKATLPSRRFRTDLLRPSRFSTRIARMLASLILIGAIFTARTYAQIVPASATDIAVLISILPLALNKAGAATQVVSCAARRKQFTHPSARVNVSLSRAHSVAKYSQTTLVAAVHFR